VNSASVPGRGVVSVGGAQGVGEGSAPSVQVEADVAVEGSADAGSSSLETGLAEHRRAMQRYRARWRQLPYTTRVTCPGCGQQVSGRYTDGAKGKVLLHYDCEGCGALQEWHEDTIWSVPVMDRPRSASSTLSGEPIKRNLRGLPRTVETLCPQCGAVVLGRYFVEDGWVMSEKCCPEHGYVRDIINRDVRLYLKSASWSFEEQAGLENPARAGSLGCPSDCGLCGRHQSCACLANVDLTNRCNLSCPICFANANATGYVYEPSYEQIVGMLKSLRSLRPTPATAVQFSGGEPTLHPQFFEIVEKAGALGFSNIQIATNGLKMADFEFARRARDAGLHTLYLQFDGIGPEVYRQTRGRDIWPAKLAAIENCRQLDMKVCLVPTVIKTINDDQVGPVFKFAVENVDVVSAISYQPVCFTGRIETEQRLEQRYTLGDLAHDLARASGAVVERDFYPLSVVMPLSQLLESLTGQPKIKPSCHTDCALGTYFLVSPDKQVYPFPAVLDIEAMFSGMNEWAAKLKDRGGRLGLWDKYKLLRFFQGLFYPGQSPAGLDAKRFVQTLQGLVDKHKGRGQAGQANYRTLMAAGMHFQDRYNYDVERTKRCVIPYATPAGLFPFCAYNSGPAYRSLVERRYARPGGQLT